MDLANKGWSEKFMPRKNSDHHIVYFINYEGIDANIPPFRVSPNLKIAQAIIVIAFCALEILLDLLGFSHHLLDMFFEQN